MSHPTTAPQRLDDAIPPVSAPPRLALAGVPLAALGVIVFGAAMLTGGDGAGVPPLAVASAVVTLCTAGAVTASATVVSRTAPITGLLAAAGSVLVAGGAWASVFVQPGIAAQAPRLLEDGVASIQIGYLLSYAILAIGWLAVGTRLAVLRVVPIRFTVLLGVGAILALIPTADPLRLLVLTIASALIARRLTRSPLRP